MLASIWSHAHSDYINLITLTDTILVGTQLAPAIKKLYQHIRCFQFCNQHISGNVYVTHSRPKRRILDATTT